MKFGIIQFPGSNCDQDAYYGVLHGLNESVDYIWHQSVELGDVDCVIVPGGFSYGDYLRCGAVAALSPVMASVKRFAEEGGLVIGICNGFQILCESGMLPGALLPNKGLRFVCKHVNVRIDNASTRFTNQGRVGDVLYIPIAHHDGCYYCDEQTLRQLKENGQVILRYTSADGLRSPQYNPNGSVDDIAGVVNAEGNVAGMMPHPERAYEPLLGSTDGLTILKSLIS